MSSRLAGDGRFDFFVVAAASDGIVAGAIVTIVGTLLFPDPSPQQKVFLVVGRVRPGWFKGGAPRYQVPQVPWKMLAPLRVPPGFNQAQG